MNRVVLGTVQLGIPYGVRAASPLVSATDAERILDAAWDLGIRAFDTAEAYGCAAERLATWLQRRGRASEARVVTKVVAGPDFREEAVRAAAARFDGSGCTVLTHGFVSHAEWEPFAEAVAAAGGAAGQSVYAPDEVRAAVAFEGMTRVQAPGNLFDARAVDARGSSAVPLDLRSAYLQGLLLSRPDDAERRVSGAGRLASAVSSAAASSGRTAVVMLLASVIRSLRSGDRVVVGVDTPQHLASIPHALDAAGRDTEALDSFERAVRASVETSVPDRVLDPRQWTA